MSQPSISEAANQHLTLEFEEYDTPAWIEAVRILKDEYGFKTSGKVVEGMDEGILPSFVKNNLKIDAGWDNWSGNYLLSNSNEGDELLRALLALLVQE